MSDSISDRLLEMLRHSDLPYVLHAHAAILTMADAEQQLPFDVARISKTIAFRRKDGGLILALLRGTARVDYPRLAELVGVNRRDLVPLSPDEVRELLGVNPGSVSPLMLRDDLTVYIEDDVLTILPTLFCGIGRPDRTLEISATDLVRLTGGSVGGFSR
ncbi:MAG: YbaK/EbsC family protein [Geobacteraceae bacterium]|nr:YbaK/EbsC family protein [Geobacteraceae bacterium]